MVGLLIGWLVGWFVDWLVGWLACWLVGWFANWFVDWLVDWLVHSFVRTPIICSSIFKYFMSATCQSEMFLRCYDVMPSWRDVIIALRYERHHGVRL